VNILSTIPTYGYIIAIVVFEIIAVLWYMSAIRRARTENASITFEKVTFIAAIIGGLIGIAAIAAFDLML
jgi:hypothetical protein